MTNREKSGTRKRIVAYDDDAEAIRERYVHMAKDNDVQLVYFTRSGDEQDGRAELLRHGVPEDLAGLATIVNKDMISDLATDYVTVEQSCIPFPQDADQYFIDGLNYFRIDNKIGYSGFVPIASRLPKEKVTVNSIDHQTREDAEKLGYSVKK